MAKVSQTHRWGDLNLNHCLVPFFLRWVLLIVSQAVLPVASENAVIQPEIASGKQYIKTARSTTSMVVTANAYATDAANSILAQGGSAVDAVITAQLVLNLVEPQSSGIGGGGFLLYWDQKNQKLVNFNGRETAPANINDKYFLLDGNIPMGFYQAVIGGYSVGVPGALDMLARAHAAYGVLPWKQLFQPAIKLSNNGFIVSPRLYESLLALKQQNKGVGNEAFYRYFFQPNGEPVAMGSLLKNPALGETLQHIADNGIDVFYEGRIADDIIRVIRKNDSKKGSLSSKDLKHYKSKIEKALCKVVATYKICGAPPPSSGPFTVIEILALLAKTPGFQGLDYNSAAFYHRFIEASKLAFADRNQYIADPAFVAVPTGRLLSEKYLNKRAQKIPLLKAGTGEVKAGVLDDVDRIQARGLALPSTTHVSIVDSQGNIVSMTTSIEHGFGSRLMVDGFILNNQLTDFSFVPRGDDNKKIANRIEPGKRPRSSMAPMIIFDKNNNPVLVIGSPGGSWIIPYVAKVISQHIFLNAPLDQAIADTHVGNLNRSYTVIEKDARVPLKKALMQLGHSLQLMPIASGIHAIAIKPNDYFGVADPRREGTAAGAVPCRQSNAC